MLSRRFSATVLRHAVALAILSGFVAMPLLCDFGYAEHDCVCDSIGCCTEEAACELDTCDDVFRTEEWRRQDAALAAVGTTFVCIQPRAAGESDLTTSTAQDHPARNQPFPASDLPLRI